MTTAYKLTRDAYHRLWRRRAWTKRVQDGRFYRQFVRAGDLVFDVGAHDGSVAEVLADIGARVVAVEPQPAMAQTIRRRYGNLLTIVEAAVGAEPGSADLHVGEQTVHSTLSDQWREAAPHWHSWRETVRVRVDTLDALIAEFGLPRFVKVDVEGFEPQALAGLTQQVHALTFEFQCPLLDAAREALERVDALGSYVFSFTLREHRALAVPWMRRAPLWEELRAVARRDPVAYGDVVAVLRRSAASERRAGAGDRA